MESSSTLCLICRTVFSEIRNIIAESNNGPKGFSLVPQFTKEQSYVHHQHFSSLESSVSDRCYICVRLWEGFDFENTNPRDLDYRCAISAMLPPSSGYLPVIMKIWFSRQGSDIHPSLLCFQARANQGRTVFRVSKGRINTYQKSVNLTQHTTISADVLLSKPNGGFQHAYRSTGFVLLARVLNYQHA
jgi:hypothetical protein